MSNDTHIFPTERANHMTVFPYPVGGETVYENPPTFVWLPPVCDDDHSVTYRVTVWDAEGKVAYSADVYGNTCVPDCLLAAGEYTWDVSAPALGTARGVERFTLTRNALPFLRPTAEEVLARIPQTRPRHLFSSDDIPALRRERAAALETLRRNIALAYEDGMPARPMFHRDEDALPYREYFGRFRDYCDRNLVACALGYHLLPAEDERRRAGEHAKALFLTLCDWNPLGPCSLCGTWGDEVGLSMARCLPAVFDLVCDLLDTKQRAYCADTVACYAKQCETRLLRLDYMKNPGNSHAGRLPAYLGEAAMVLWGEPGQDRETLTRWLSYALSVYSGMFPFFGTSDGGWAEGTFYATSYTKWYLPFFSAVARYTGKSFFDRPFYRNYARYLLHFALPDHEIHPFGDGYWCSPDSPEWPGFFAQNPFRIYADVAGLPEAKRYDEQLSSQEIFKLHLLDVFLPSAGLGGNADRTAPVTDADAFPEAGFVSLHSDRTQPERDLHVMARASKFGHGSHRHPDNGSFAVFIGGTAMLAPSGYFGREYGTQHHMQWLNSTKAHNAILVDGIGQTFGEHRHTGKVVSCGIDDCGVRYTVLDLSPSYPMLTRWVRIIRITDAHTVGITDDIASAEPHIITYPLHTLSRPVRDGICVTVHRNGHDMTVTPAAGCFETLSLSDRYDVDLNAGVPEEFHVTMPEQFHIYYETEARTEHHICVTIHID